MSSGKNSYTMQGGLDMLGSNFVEGNEGGGLGAGEQGLVWRVDLGGFMLVHVEKNAVHSGSMGHMGPDSLALSPKPELFLPKRSFLSTPRPPPPGC